MNKSVRTTQNDLFHMDNEVQRESLKKLADLKLVTHVFTAHYGYSDTVEKVFQDFK
ncbi:hypothetical protein KJ966_01895 [bacterium]|nr:hypothetical protein [bacterium]